MSVSIGFLRSHSFVLARYLTLNRNSRITRCWRRSYAVVGNPTADKALNAVTGGRIESWLQQYEDLVGLTEVKEAQNHVIQAEKRFEQAQIDRRAQQQQMTALHIKLKEIHAALDKVQRGEERYLALLTDEYEVLRQEKQIVTTLTESERTERDSFAALSSAVRESHERERARAERTKYWTIIGSVIGATIGIVGTTINNYRRMRELKALVHDSATGGAELSRSVLELVDATRSQQDELKAVLGYLGTSSGSGSDPPTAVLEKSKLSCLPVETDVRELVIDNNRSLELHMTDVKRMISALSAHSNDGQTSEIVYVGPEMNDLLAKTELNIERNAKWNAVASSLFLYTAGVVTAVVAYTVLAGRS